MLTKEVYENYILILKDELIEALGCTEPIAIAYATTKAKAVLGKQPKRMEVGCSGIWSAPLPLDTFTEKIRFVV